MFTGTEDYQFFCKLIEGIERLRSGRPSESKVMLTSAVLLAACVFVCLRGPRKRGLTNENLKKWPSPGWVATGRPRGRGEEPAERGLRGGHHKKAGTRGPQAQGTFLFVGVTRRMKARAVGPSTPLLGV